MAVRESASNNGGASRRAWFVAACLVVLFLAALFLRAYWNLDAANPAEGTFVLSGDGDPYYHKRAVDAIQASGFHHLLGDPLLNYPVASENPNPPLFQWSIAVSGKLMESFFDPVTSPDGVTLSSLQVSTWYAALWMPTIFSALTVFTIYALGAALFDRRAGLVAALLWTVSTAAIDAGGVSHTDHDSTVIFFVTLSMLFYIQALRHLRYDGNWISSWKSSPAITKGLGNLFRQRGTGFAYALATAVSIAAVALTWKGFNYVIGIIFLYAIFQIVVDHWRNKDSTAIFLATLIAIGGGVLLALPYYSTAAVGNFLQPTWYILVAFIVAGLILVPTRDMPSILVMPAALIAGIVLAVASFFVFPDVARSLLYATVYFKQTRLYETIGEAHGADFSSVAFGVGPVAFFLALAGWVYLLFTIKRHPTRPIVFALVWAAVAFFMVQSAVRFLINAIPVFCIFAGFFAIWLIDALEFSSIRKSLAANRGNFWQGLRRGTRPLHIVMVILVALLFVLPTTILAADAALPPEEEQKISSASESDFVQRFFNERMGAYGQSYGGVGPWIAPMQFLDARDANITDIADRPAFISWWDYGHWAIGIGRHPTVADPFQNGYELAANFILSQNEAAAIQLLAARTAQGPNADLEGALRAAGSADPAGDAVLVRSWQQVNLTVAQSAVLLATLEEQTGKSIRYFAVDIRMLPYDNPQTASIDQSSIFYAPVKLKGDVADDYVTTKINLGVADRTAADGFVTLERYEELARDPIRQVQALGDRFDYQEKFFDSMYWRSYVGTPAEAAQPGEPILGSDVEAALGNPRPAVGLEHFRAVYIGDIQRLYKGGDPSSSASYIYYPGVVIVEYYPGVTIEGTVTEDGAPVSGATVTVLDDAGTLLANAFGSQADPAAFNVPHAQTTTAAGIWTFRIIAPFAMPGGAITLDAARGGISIGTTQLAVTREQSDARATIPGVTISVARGIVEGTAFTDVDGNGAYSAANDTILADVNVTIGDVTVTTTSNGTYRAEGVSAGLQNVRTTTEGLQVAVATNRVRVQPGATVTHDVALEAKAASVTGQLLADLSDDGNVTDDEVIEFQTVNFAADASVPGNTAVNVTAFTEQGGNFTVQLRPGTYSISSDYTDRATGTVYRLQQTLSVLAGQTVTSERLVMTKA